MDDESLDGLFYNLLNGSRGIDGFFERCFGFFRRKSDLFLQPDKAFKSIEMNFELNKKKFVEQKDKEERLKKKKQLEEELKRREEENKKNANTNTNTSTNTNTNTNTTTTTTSSKSEPTVRELTPEEFERKKRLEKELAELGSRRLNNDDVDVVKEVKEPTNVQLNQTNTNNITTTNTNISSNSNTSTSSKSHPDSTGVIQYNSDGLPYLTPDKNKALIEPNHPCLKTEWGVSKIKEIHTDEHGNTKIMPDRNHGGEMEKYSWGQNKIEEGWITIPIDKSIKGKEVKISADSTSLTVSLRGQEYLKRDFLKPINVSFVFIIKPG